MGKENNTKNTQRLGNYHSDIAALYQALITKLTKQSQKHALYSLQGNHLNNENHSLDIKEEALKIAKNKDIDYIRGNLSYHLQQLASDKISPLSLHLSSTSVATLTEAYSIACFKELASHYNNALKLNSNLQKESLADNITKKGNELAQDHSQEDLYKLITNSKEKIQFTSSIKAKSPNFNTKIKRNNNVIEAKGLFRPTNLTQSKL